MAPPGNLVTSVSLNVLVFINSRTRFPTQNITYYKWATDSRKRAETTEYFGRNFGLLIGTG